ncbi:MAG: flavodoxin domain-containing protein [Ilumatobacteraceae bacterium]|nr:flavodoxin domain-containing protein [Ilumatobacteraceae bacterium]
MRAVVVYESMFGNTHVVADHIAEGMRPDHDVTVVPVDEATAEVLAGVELLVVGGPTHAHGMVSEASRTSAVEMAHRPGSGLELDPDAEGEGLRHWFHHLPKLPGVRAAAFDTRMGSVSPIVSGRASKGIAKRLRHHGLELAADPESFLVDKENHLIEGEALRAREWGESLR